MLANLHGLFDATWRTIEPEKRDRINYVWSQQELRIVNTSAPVDSTGDMMVIPRSALVHMAQKLQKDACGMCFGTHSERKDCLFRKAMVELSIPDLRKHEKQTGKCLGHLYQWEE